MRPESLRLITRLEEAHVAQLLELYQHEWWTRGRTLEDVERMLDGTTYVFALCTAAENRLVGFARVLTDGVFKGIIFDVIVAAPYRHMGLGARLMNAIVEHPVLCTVRHLELYCLPDMVSFYENWQFSTEVSGVTYMRRIVTSAR
ncbi:MAG TPA: GNAT family N-acetyltransferase [Vicinamibacterales bacterium]|nr:GNAT family N-acetyltransferase [Vicinamibacterales bacterium]